MKVEIYLNKDALTGILKEKSISKDFLKKVATVETNSTEVLEALEECFKIGQNKSYPWHQHPRVESDLEDAFRSISVGDILKIDNTCYVVSPLGFEKINLIS